MGNQGFLYQTIIATTPEKLWAALTTAEFTRQYWFGRSVESDWKVGSPVTITTPEGSVEVQGKVLAVEPNKRLSYTWGSGTATDNTTVVFEITQMGPLCKLLITHDIDLAASGAQQTMNGWTFILCGLKTFLETGKPMPAIPWRK
ncbi:MAG TPA: SRPBCC domain-containing protein [Spirochaetia bacterium]|nr:SRPBCC domain-containing protein [Spirochaetia bacterium]